MRCQRAMMSDVTASYACPMCGLPGVCMRACVHTCVGTYTYTCIHAYIQACIHTCMHTYIHTYTHAVVYTDTVYSHVLLYAHVPYIHTSHCMHMYRIFTRPIVCTCTVYSHAHSPAYMHEHCIYIPPVSIHATYILLYSHIPLVSLMAVIMHTCSPDTYMHTHIRLCTRVYRCCS